MPRPRRRAVLALAALAVAAPATAAHAAGDPYRSQQHGLEQIRAEEAWATARGDGVVVAIVDSGVDVTHPDLVSQLHRVNGQIVGRDFVDDDEDPSDVLGHGTLVAGIAAAATDNDEGISGVAPNARIMPIRVLDDDGRGSLRDIDAAIRWAVDNGADVVNLSLEGSLGATTGSSSVLQAPAQAVDYAWSKGVVVVAAAGNDGGAFTDYPASSPIVLVGATNRAGERAEFSDTGRRDAVLAPGVDIVSTWCRRNVEVPCSGIEHTYGEADGTSFAAPHVSGALAVLLSAGADAPSAVAALRRGAVDLGPAGPDDANGHGRIDVAAALSALAAGGGAEPGGAGDGGDPGTDPTAAENGGATSAPPPGDGGQDGDGDGTGTGTGEDGVPTDADATAAPGDVVTTPDADVAPVDDPQAAGAAAGDGPDVGLLRWAALLLVLGTGAGVEWVRRDWAAQDAAAASAGPDVAAVDD